ncbi:hypothetical protein BGZ76_007648 [Entomortierella beljakovae]|nr:hypothetical protein BGZ76_007648 [Entomortierella beljakovae]
MSVSKIAQHFNVKRTTLHGILKNADTIQGLHADQLGGSYRSPKTAPRSVDNTSPTVNTPIMTLSAEMDALSLGSTLPMDNTSSMTLNTEMDSLTPGSMMMMLRGKIGSEADPPIYAPKDIYFMGVMTNPSSGGSIGGDSDFSVFLSCNGDGSYKPNPWLAWSSVNVPETSVRELYLKLIQQVKVPSVFIVNESLWCHYLHDFFIPLGHFKVIVVPIETCMNNVIENFTLHYLNKLLSKKNDQVELDQLFYCSLIYETWNEVDSAAISRIFHRKFFLQHEINS